MVRYSQEFSINYRYSLSFVINWRDKRMNYKKTQAFGLCDGWLNLTAKHDNVHKFCHFLKY